MKTLCLRIKNIFIAIVCVFVFHNLASAQQLAMPKYDVTDKFGVSVITGEVTSGADTLSIGGAMGLSHKIFSHSNNFLMKNPSGAWIGPYDNFNGSALYSEMVAPNTTFQNPNQQPINELPFFEMTRNSGSGAINFPSACTTSGTCICNSGLWVMRVNDGSESAEFRVVYISGNSGVPLCKVIDGISNSYFYYPLRDKKNKLDVEGTDSLKWTKSDGTEVYFYRGSTYADAKGYLKKIIHPNGFTINFARPDPAGLNSLGSVSTNTGFLLKYNYSLASEPYTTIGANYGNDRMPTNDEQANWNRRNPKSITGINQAIEYCNPNDNAPCVGAQESCPATGVGQASCTSLTKKWPIAKFIWPAGMPRAFFFGDNKFTLMDSAQRATDFLVKGVDACAATGGGTISASCTLNTKNIPILVGVKPAGSNAATVNYQYVNDNYLAAAAWSVYSLPSNTTSLTRASGMRGDSGVIYGSYSGTRAVNGVSAFFTGRMTKDLYSQFYEQTFRSLYCVDSKESAIFFEGGYRNFPAHKTHTVDCLAPTDDIENDMAETYSYDGNDNLTRIEYNKKSASPTEVQAIYPASCPDGASKTCHQPTDVRDAKGSWTSYTYHPESGQVLTITLPSNKNNLVAKTIFTYEQKYAQYIQTPGGSKTNAPTPVWMKATEKTCLTSSEAGCGAGSSDEVLTKYEYNDNLLVKGITVTAVDSSGYVTTKRTCYQYDIYGNRIGETQPKAYLASCN
jgi:hypothetical protein